MWPNENKRAIFKIMFVTVLILIFIKYFGFSAFEKYLEKRTLFSEETVEYQNKDAPEMLLHYMKIEDNIENINNAHIIEKLIHNCFKKTNNSFNESLGCIENVTFSKEEYLPGKVEMWKTSFGPFFRGRAYVRRAYWSNKYPMVFKFPEQTLIDLFDPKFYLVTEKTSVNPRLRFLVKENHIAIVNIKMEKVHILKSNQDCSMDPSYSFTDCIQVCLNVQS